MNTRRVYAFTDGERQELIRAIQQRTDYFSKDELDEMPWAYLVILAKPSRRTEDGETIQ